MNIWLALLALVIEAMTGYPPLLFAAIGHPVSWIGALIAWLDRWLNHDAAPFATRRALGVTALVVVLAMAGSVAALIAAVAEAAPGGLGLALTAIVASTLLAQRSLGEHVAAVARALEQDGLDAGRAAVGMIVGRDPATLDEPAVCRAAIESLAENFSDGIVAPAFWLAGAGLPGICLYKSINTADSMIGHRSPRYLAFGWAAARLDDLVNLPASRLAVIWIALAAVPTRRASATAALAAAWRDAGRHTSPNAGWPEAAMAGALGLKLAGPRTYAGKTVDAAWMGSGRSYVDAADIRRALVLYRRACAAQMLVLALLALGMTGVWLG